MTVKKTSLIFLLSLIACLFIGVQFALMPHVQNKIEEHFIGLGFKHAQINQTSIDLDGITIQNITLDKDKFNTLEDVDLSLNWPKFITTGAVKHINIETLKISSVINSPKDLLRYKHQFRANKIKALTQSDVTIDNIIWDVAAQKTALRFTGNLSSKSKGDQPKDLKFALNAAQKQLSFNSEWSGTIDQNGALSLDGNYSDFNIHTNSLKTKRGTGWINYSNTEGGAKTALQEGFWH